MKKICLLILGYSFTMSLSALESSNPTTLSQKKEEVWHPRAAINNNGAATVVWIKSRGDGLYSLQTSSRAQSEAYWTQDEPISEPMKISTYFPSVANDGTSTIIWTTINMQQYYYTKKEIKELSKSWSLAKEIQYSGLSKIKNVIVDSDGELLVLASPDKNPIFSFLYKSDGESPKPYPELPMLPKSNENQAFGPLLLKSSEGKIAALWCNLKDAAGYKDYHFKSSLYDNGTWNTKIDDLGRLNFTNLNNPKAKSTSASLNKKNEFAVIWNCFESPNHNLKTIVTAMPAARENVSSLTQVQEFFIGKPAEIADCKYKIIKESPDGFTDSAICIDDNGNVVAVWIEPFKKHTVVYAAYKSQNQEWQAAQILSNFNNNAEHVQLSFSNGVFVVVWGESDSGAFKRSIFGVTLAPAEKCKWLEPILLSPKDENCWHPSIAFGEKGGIITWTSHVQDSPDFQIQVANLIAP